MDTISKVWRYHDVEQDTFAKLVDEHPSSQYMNLYPFILNEGSGYKDNQAVVDGAIFDQIEEVNGER